MEIKISNHKEILMKKFNSGLLVAFVLTMIGALLVGGATMALFTDTAENTGNSFAAGTLTVDLDKQGEERYFELSNIAPGDRGSATITVINSGSLALRYKFDDLVRDGYLVALNGEEGEFGQYPVEFTFKVDGQEIRVGENGTFLELKPGQSQDVTVEWELPLNAGNDYQNKQGSIGISVYAEQIQNNPLSQ
jgi:predicted ribosomally synthesized peptide with SipW-like signal peptide